MSSSPGIEDNWNATGNCGYTAVWHISIKDDESIVVKEQPGAKCCGCVPNPNLKTHKMKKVSTISHIILPFENESIV
jgi:hypothetical protein